MLSDQKFFLCEICGNLVGMINESGVPIICCEQPMTELQANTADASKEKHVPVIKADNGKITVAIGSVDHPMLPEHHIEWIYLKTNQGGHRKGLKAGDKPAANFILSDGEKALTAYAYCNLHGLWKSDI